MGEVYLARWSASDDGFFFTRDSSPWFARDKVTHWQPAEVPLPPTTED